MEPQAAVTPTNGTRPPRTETEAPEAPPEAANGGSGGLRCERRFTVAGVSPYDEVEWELRDAVITDEHGDTIFAQRGVEFPKSWSLMATTIVASKYFHGSLEKGERETSVRQLVSRVANQIADWGLAGDYFADREAAEAFRDELTYLLLNQYAAFNSPVWFNCGVEKQPQCSACFINSVEDTMDSILTLAKTEGMLFKWGSGTGSNLSSIRSSRERLSSGGAASGPVSFMKGYDSFAGVIRSGGKTRRAAKMVILNVDHPDILEFIDCKSREEQKALTLIDAGYDGSLNGEAYESIQYQNANHSVRVTDAFMEAVAADAPWQTRAITTGDPMDDLKAREVFRRIAESAHRCGDPGMQFDDTINRWHTSKNSGRINASNPCSEYMYLDDSACNLASLNLMKFLDADGEFDTPAFEHAVDVMLTGMEIIVGNASYPTPRIEKNSHAYRPLGLGYANLGALLMRQGIPYDSADGRAVAASLTSLMTGRAYAQSARLAAVVGPFEGYAPNEEPFLEVMRRHRDAADEVSRSGVPEEVGDRSREVWNEAIALGEEHGFRNGQASVLAPTGTIGLMMDCDTTGVEPDLSLIKHKKLTGGGVIRIVNQTVGSALERLGYSPEEVERLRAHVDEHGHIEGAPDLREEHLPVFDCALEPAGGGRSIHYMGHVKMMHAVQPFLSGAISKTVNMPEESTVEDIEETYIESWKLGLKAVAIYRDGSKGAQPLNRGDAEEANAAGETSAATIAAAEKEVLPDEREAVIHKFEIAGHKGYLTVGLRPDGSPCEIFLRMAKEGSFVSGLMDAFARAVSYNLQNGVPLRVLVDKFIHTRFEPSGYTGNPEIPRADSITDYIFRWLELRFLNREERHADEEEPAAESAAPETPAYAGNGSTRANGAPPSPSPARRATRQEVLEPAAVFADAPPCFTCGALMVRSGTCFKCLNCGATSGCS